MTKSTNIILAILSLLFIFIGIKSLQHSTPYAELTGIESIEGSILKLHCPYKGAAALSLKDTPQTFNLSLKFKGDYCENNNFQSIIGKTVQLKAQRTNNDYYQVYELKEKDKVILSPQEVESDRSSSTFGLFFLAFLLIALMVYKNRKKLSKEPQTN